uniref:Glutathione S-transferase n=1 Tax=Gongylonema pulchrum TaxID=637853 RepID=A0A183D2V2_9BILA
LHETYRQRRDRIPVASKVSMCDLLAATVSLLTVDKVLMADRPGDRGGRPSELRAPPPEMPSWKKDRAPGGTFN